jgi:hypothetical protein
MGGVERERERKTMVAQVRSHDGEQVATGARNRNEEGRKKLLLLIC